MDLLKHIRHMHKMFGSYWNTVSLYLEMQKHSVLLEEVRVLIEKTVSKQILLDPKLFLLGPYLKKHNYRKKEQVIYRSQLALCRKMYCNAMEEHSQAKRCSMD